MNSILRDAFAKEASNEDMCEAVLFSLTVSASKHEQSAAENTGEERVVSTWFVTETAPSHFVEPC